MASNGTTGRRRTPDHPPYALMIGTAIKSLAEEGGSTEESISRFIRSHYTNIPPGHDLLLPYYLHRLTARAEFLVSVPGRYLVPPEEEEEKRNDLQKEKKNNGDPTEEQKEGEDSVSIEEGLPLVCKGDLVMEIQALASSPGLKPVEVPVRKRGRPSTKTKKKMMSPETMGLPESGGGLLVLETALFPVVAALERDTLEPDNGPRKRGRPRKKNDMMSTGSVGLAESGGCGGSLVSTFASESVAPERDNLEPNNEADEPDNRPRKRGRPRKRNAMSCLAESGGCGLSVSTFASEPVALDRNNLEPNNVGDKPDNSPRKRGRPLKKKKNMSPETIVPGESGDRGLSVSSLSSVPVALELDNVEHKKELDKPNTVPKRLGRPPKSKPMLAADETPTSKCEPEFAWATAEKSTGKRRGRPLNSGEKTENGEPESAGVTLEKKTGKRLGRPPKNSGKEKDKGEPESAGTTVEKSTAKHHGRTPNTGEVTDNGEPESVGATMEKKMDKRLGRPLKNSNKKMDKGEPESAWTTVEKSTAKHHGRPPNSGEETANGEAESAGATMEKKTGMRLGRPPKNSGKKKDKDEPESVGTTEEKSTAKYRGRPPKTKTDNGELVVAMSKRLGRPPKNSGKKTMEEKTGKLCGGLPKQKPDAMVLDLGHNPNTIVKF